MAGHETTSTATAWALYALTQSPDVQVKLRHKLLSIPTDNPSMDELNDIPYLDAVVREALRLYAPVPVTLRVAVKDDILPLGSPIRTTKGELIDSIRLVTGYPLRRQTTHSLCLQDTERSNYSYPHFSNKPQPENMGCGCESVQA